MVLVGGHPALGSWDVANALPMSWSDGHVWKGSVELPADTLDLQYKVSAGMRVKSRVIMCAAC